MNCVIEAPLVWKKNVLITNFAPITPEPVYLRHNHFWSIKCPCYRVKGYDRRSKIVGDYGDVSKSCLCWSQWNKSFHNCDILPPIFVFVYIYSVWCPALLIFSILSIKIFITTNKWFRKTGDKIDIHIWLLRCFILHIF